MRTRSGVSPVIATVILAGTVLMIGGGIWAYSLGAASSVATDYTETTKDLVHTIIERFNIEHVDYDSTTQNVSIWVYNYGDIQIEVDTNITIGNSVYQCNNTYINSREIEKIDVNVGVLSSNDEVSVKIFTERENADYEVYYVP